MQLTPTPSSISLRLQSSRGASIKRPQEDVYFPEVSARKMPNEVQLQVWACKELNQRDSPVKEG